MNEEVFNLELRKFLKRFGVTAQGEIEKAVDGALKNRALLGNEVDPGDLGPALAAGVTDTITLLRICVTSGDVSVARR